MSGTFLLGHPVCGVIDCNGWKTQKCHECANMGKVKDLNFDGSCTSCHFLRGMYNISDQWIFVQLSVQVFVV